MAWRGENCQTLALPVMGGSHPPQSMADFL